MKHLGVLALIAVAAATLVANRASASSTPPVTSSISTVLASNSSDHRWLLKGVTLTARSVSVTSNLDSVLLTQQEPGAGLKHVVVLGGHHPPIVHLDRDRSAQPSSHPIPEARSLLLYALGLLTIGGKVLRSRKTAQPHLA